MEVVSQQGVSNVRRRSRRSFHLDRLTAIAALRAAGERGDANAVAELLAPDVVFHSPLTTRARFEGREEVAALHRDIFAVLEGSWSLASHRRARCAC